MWFVIDCDIELNAGHLHHGDMFDQDDFLAILNANDLEYIPCVVCVSWVVASDWQSILRCKVA